MDVSIFAAFLAGLVSFLSPCVLPLVPGYISMLSGIGVEQLKEGKTPRAGLLAKISVRAGLLIGCALVAAGIALTVRAGLLPAWLKPIHFVAIALIFLLGPSLTRWLNRDVRFQNLGGQPGAASGFLMGFAFAFGWTPCIGPILASVLAVAATRDTVWQGIFLLAVYSAGLAIPFLVT